MTSASRMIIENVCLWIFCWSIWTRRCIGLYLLTVYAWKSMKYAGVILPYVCFSHISFLEWNSFGKRNFCNYYICQARLKRVPRANICTNWINSELYWPSSGNLSTVDKHRGAVSSILNDHLSVVLRKSQKGPKLSGRS